MSQSYYLFIRFLPLRFLFWFGLIFCGLSFPCYLHTPKSIWYLDLGMMGLQDDGPYLYIYIFGFDALSESFQQIIHEYKQCHK